MKARKKYCALILLLVFTIPVIFQPGHLLLHAKKGDSGSSFSVPQNCSHFKKDADEVFTLAKTKKTCPICEFEFTEYNTAENQTHTFVSTITKSPYRLFFQASVSELDWNCSSLRAPPSAC